MKMKILCVAAAICMVSVPVRAAELTLADGGRSDYKIVVADDASPSTKHGAEELQKFLQEISGARLPIVSDKTPQGPKEIVLGQSARLKSVAPTPMWFAFASRTCDAR